MSIENRTLKEPNPRGMLCECKSTNLDYYNANCYIDIAPQTLKSNAKKTSESGGAHVLHRC